MCRRCRMRSFVRRFLLKSGTDPFVFTLMVFSTSSTMVMLA